MHEPVSLRAAIDTFSDVDGWTDAEARRRRHNSARMFFNDGQVRSQVPVSRGKTALYGPPGVLVLRFVLFAHEAGLNRAFVAAMSDWLHGADTDLAHPSPDELNKVRSLANRAEGAVTRMEAGERIALVCDHHSRWSFQFDPPPVQSDMDEQVAEVLADDAIASPVEPAPLRVRFHLDKIVRPVFDRLAGESEA